MESELFRSRLTVVLLTPVRTRRSNYYKLDNMNLFRSRLHQAAMDGKPFGRSKLSRLPGISDGNNGKRISETLVTSNFSISILTLFPPTASPMAGRSATREGMILNCAPARV